MRLGILVYSLSGGGAERVVSYLLAHLKSMEIEIHLILMNDTIKYEVPPDIQVHYIEKSNPQESGLKKLVKIPSLAYRYGKLSKELQLTHSMSLLTRPNYINILSRYFNRDIAKLIISERAYPSLQYGYGNFNSKINKFLIAGLYSKADQIICNSEGNSKDLIENFGVLKKRIAIINNPIDLKKIDQIGPISDFFDPDYFNLISVGRLDEGKNHKLLINAISSLNGVRLYILGEGTLKRELEDLISTKNLGDRVFLLGYVDNPYRFLKGADLFVFGSNHEGFPNVLLEAMACGLPILTTNCKSGPSEILELKIEEIEDIMLTDYGILVPINNEKIFIKGIQHFISRPNYYSSCKINAKKRVKDFKIANILDKYKQVIFQ